MLQEPRWGSWGETRPVAIWRESALVSVERMAKKGKMDAGPGEAAGAAEVSLLGSREGLDKRVRKTSDLKVRTAAAKVGGGGYGGPFQGCGLSDRHRN